MASAFVVITQQMIDEALGIIEAERSRADAYSLRYLMKRHCGYETDQLYKAVKKTKRYLKLLNEQSAEQAAKLKKKPVEYDHDSSGNIINVNAVKVTKTIKPIRKTCDDLRFSKNGARTKNGR